MRVPVPHLRCLEPTQVKNLLFGRARSVAYWLGLVERRPIPKQGKFHRIEAEGGEDEGAQPARRALVLQVQSARRAYSLQMEAVRVGLERGQPTATNGHEELTEAARRLWRTDEGLEPVVDALQLARCPEALMRDVLPAHELLPIGSARSDIRATHGSHRARQHRFDERIHIEIVAMA